MNVLDTTEPLTSEWTAVGNREFTSIKKKKKKESAQSVLRGLSMEPPIPFLLGVPSYPHKPGPPDSQ